MGLRRLSWRRGRGRGGGGGRRRFWCVRTIYDESALNVPLLIPIVLFNVVSVVAVDLGYLAGERIKSAKRVRLDPVVNREGSLLRQPLVLRAYFSGRSGRAKAEPHAEGMPLRRKVR